MYITVIDTNSALYIFYKLEQKGNSAVLLTFTQTC